MNLIDSLDLYAQLNDSDDLFLMLQDYTLDERINREMLNKIIIKDLGNARPFTTNTKILKFGIDEFFDKYNYNITRLIDTMYLDYNPLTNKNVFEEDHRRSVGDIDNTDSYTTNTDNQESGTYTREEQVSAYDTSCYQPKDKEITTPARKIDNDVSHRGTTTSDILSTVDAAKTITGKDGPESYQTLIEQERRLAEFNIFRWIIGQMRRELFLLVY